MDCGDLESKRYPFYFDYLKMQEMIQPFVMPKNIDADPSFKPEIIGTDDSDIKFNYEYCLHRFLGEAQVASANYQGNLFRVIDNWLYKSFSNNFSLAQLFCMKGVPK